MALCDEQRRGRNGESNLLVGIIPRQAEGAAGAAWARSRRLLLLDDDFSSLFSPSLCNHARTGRVYSRGGFLHVRHLQRRERSCDVQKCGLDFEPLPFVIIVAASPHAKLTMHERSHYPMGLRLLAVGA